MEPYKKRIEIVVTDEGLGAFIEERATEAGYGVGPYLLALARALYLFEEFGKTRLLGLLGVFDLLGIKLPVEGNTISPPAIHPPTETPTQNTDLLDSVLDQM